MVYHPYGHSFPKAVLLVPPSTHIQFLSFSQLMPVPHTSLSKRKQSGRDSLIFPASKLLNFSINFLTQHPYWFYCGWSISTSIKVQSWVLDTILSCIIKDLSPTLPVSLISPFLLGPYHTLQTYYILSDAKNKNRETKDFLIPHILL